MNVINNSFNFQETLGTPSSAYNLQEILGTPANPSWAGSVLTVGVSIAFIAFVFTLFIYAISNYKRYSKVKGWLAFALSSTAFFAIGILTLAVIAIPFGICYYFIAQSRKGNILPIWVTVSLISGYITISFIGWLSKKYIIDKIEKYEKKNIKMMKKWAKDNKVQGFR